jgi:hypothetical protein
VCRWSPPGILTAPATSSNSRAAYTAKEIDFIAVYIVPENLWYVIPISVAAHRGQMYVSPLRHPPFQA